MAFVSSKSWELGQPRCIQYSMSPLTRNTGMELRNAGSFLLPLKKYGVGNGAQMLQRDKKRRNNKNEIAR